MQVNDLSSLALSVTFDFVIHGMIIVGSSLIFLLCVMLAAANLIDLICGNPLHYSFKKWTGSSSNAPRVNKNSGLRINRYRSKK